MPVDASKLQIVNYPHAVLRQVAQSIDSVTDEVRDVATKMIELMHLAPGVGLAAPQVGLPWRMFVANASGEAGDDFVFINPVLSNPSRDVEDYEEGCLSLPSIKAEIRRPKAITITATNLEGEEISLTSDELPARIWQHETDHLDGVLIIDRMTAADRRANRKLIKELEAAD